MSTSDTTQWAIRVRDARKRFRLYHDLITGPIKELLFFWKRESFYDPLMAVDGVSFEVRRGEVVGIIGPNGAGKTTLLKMIAGLLPVDGGSVEVRGKVTALLALGVGVHPEFTGRENIYYGGLLLGMSRDTILEKMDAIVDFAEVGEFIDRPLRTYSSGMRARLLFSISMSVEPDVLIVDEALATGDTYFVAKCRDRMRQISRSGATILLVSHNLAQVAEMCDRTIVMADGGIIFDGSSSEAIATYYEWSYRREVRRLTEDAEPLQPQPDKPIEVTAIELRDREGRISTGFRSGEPMHVDIRYESRLPEGTEAHLFLGILRYADHAYLGEINSHWYVEQPGSPAVQRPLSLDPGGTIRVSLDPLLLLTGRYALWLILSRGPSIGPEVLYEARGVSTFFVGRREYFTLDDGVFWQPARIAQWGDSGVQ